MNIITKRSREKGTRRLAGVETGESERERYRERQRESVFERISPAETL